jgi:hypothetical protein
MHRTLFLGFLCFLFLEGCNSTETKEPAVETAVTVSPTVYRYTTFANVDSTGQSHGFGYDIYDGEKKLIHQTNIPGEPGVDGFVSEEEAGIIAQVVVDKLDAGGGFPTLTREELVSKGITLKQ